MSLLYPLFLAGLAAVGLPILLHMIRRPTRERVKFSSLMFLRTTAPRLRNRSRLEHLPLLALRCLVLCLLAFAFARPFLPRSAPKREVRVGKRMALLIDTSASMRRAGMWAQAVSEARTVLGDAGPADRVSVMGFDQGVRTVLGFEQWKTMDPSQRVTVATQQMSELSPGWARTDLGRALVAAAEALEDDEVNDEEQPAGSRQIVLISDVQRGSELDALKAYAWPERTELVVRSVTPQGTSNAAMQLMAKRGELAQTDEDERPKIRITNEPDSTREQFQLGWAGETPAGTTGPPADVYVPPGHSVVVRAPARVSSIAQKLVLTGDDHGFDNALYVAPQVQRPINILYLGSDEPNDPEAMLFYARQAFEIEGELTCRVFSKSGNEALSAEEIETAHLIVVAGPVGSQAIAPLQRYLESGRTILLAMASTEAAAALSDLTGIDGLECQEADVIQYAMLSRMDFEHPLLAPFSDPRFGDFTRIHFWRHRRIDLTNCPGAQVLAWFDSEDAAWFEIAVGKGSLLVWTCGWHPSDSDLALSSKFAPLLYSALEYGGALTVRQSQYRIGDAVPLPTWATRGSEVQQVRKPDGSIVRLDADEEAFAHTDIPGVYTAQSGDDSRRFAINLPARESRTDPLPIESLEELGVTTKPASDVAVERTERAAAHIGFTEMESQQKLWRWVITAALLALLIEIWLGGRLTRPDRAP
ncbi:MAG: BatA domain-containing protein, partial [Planctomycetota bacterium]